MNQKLGSVCLILVVIIFDVYGRQNITIGLLVPETIQGMKSLLGLQALEALLMAVDDINNSSTILPHYHLNIVYNDSGCTAQTAIASTLWQLITYPDVITFIGGGCTADAISISLLSGVYSVPTISYASTLIGLTDTNGQHTYPTFMRVVPPDSLQVEGWVAISKYYGWSRVGILTTTEDLNIQFNIAFTQLANTMQVVSQTFFSGETNVTTQLKYLQNQGCRIIYVACDYTDTVNVFLSALEVGMVGAEYVWIGSDSWMVTDFWADCFQNITLQNIVKNSVRGSIGLAPAVENSTRADLFLRQYVKRTNWTKPNNYAFYAYDAAWTLGLALHQMIEVQGQVPVPTKQFKLQLLQQLKNTKFEGVTGKVMFKEDGDRVGQYELFNFRPDGSMMSVGIYDPDRDKLHVHTKVIWYNGTQVPKDRSNNCSDIQKQPEFACEYKCTDTITGHVCTCSIGYYLREDQRSCQVLPCIFTTWSEWNVFHSSPSNIITRTRGYNNSVIQTSPLCYNARLKEYLKVYKEVTVPFFAIMVLEQEWQDWLATQLFDIYQLNITLYSDHSNEIFISIDETTNVTCNQQFNNIYGESFQNELKYWASLIIPSIESNSYNFSMEVQTNHCIIVMTIGEQTTDPSILMEISVGVTVSAIVIIFFVILLFNSYSRRLDLSSLPPDIRKIVSSNRWTKLPTGIFIRDLSRDESKWLRGLLEEYLDGKTISIHKITAVYNVDLLSAFVNKRKVMITRAKNSPNLFYKESWRNRNPGNKRSIIRQHYDKYVQNFSWNKDFVVPIVPMLYATDEESAIKICVGGFSNLAMDMNCFYGQGIYLTTSAKYALSHLKKKKNVVLLMVYVMPGNIYPTTETPHGEQSLEGMPIMSGYQSHYVLTNSKRLPSLPSPTTNVYTELVIGEESQIFPTIVLYPQSDTQIEKVSQSEDESTSYDYVLLPLSTL